MSASNNPTTDRVKITDEPTTKATTDTVPTSPVTLAAILAGSRADMAVTSRTMSAMVKSAVGENANTDRKRAARAEIKIRLAAKLAPDTLTVTLHRDGKGGYEICETLDTEHGERILTGTLRLTDRKTLSARALSRVNALLRSFTK